MAEVDSVPPAQKASWSQFLKTILSASGDLSSLSAPSFILSPVSLSEFPSYWGEPTQLFTSIPAASTPEERMLAVTKWFLSTLSGQFTRREKEMGMEKKPLNPVLGEVFKGVWNGDGAVCETSLYAEQVSHHPPITAYHLSTPSIGLSLSGHCAQKTSFTGRTIVVKQVGHAILKLEKTASRAEEKYLITLPKLVIEGLLYGKPYVELCEHSFIQSSTGLTTKIEYRGKGWVSGHSHGFSATISPSSSSAKALYKIDGHWTSTSSYTYPKELSGTSFANFGPELARSPVSVKPVEEQEPFESRRLWQHVSHGIRTGDFLTAGEKKNEIEESERRKRKEESDSAKSWSLRGFTRVEEDHDYEELAKLCGHHPTKEDSYTVTKN